MNEYILHEMAKIRIDELREEASRARGARGSRRRRHYLGILGVSGAPRGDEAGGSSRRTVEEACCA